MTTALEKDVAAPAAAGRRGSHALRWWVLAVLGVAQLMVVLDATVVNIALPEAQLDLGFSNADRQWVITGYALAFGSLLLLGGRLSDLFGRRNTFIAGLVGFAVASAVGGAAANFEVLVGARVAQGVFGALLAPAALSLLTVTFTEPTERAKAFGIFGAIAGAGGALGLLLGGALTEWASWRWGMYVNLVFAAVALVGAVMLLAKHVATERPKLDIPGTITVTAALFAIVYGFSHAESDGWTNSVTLAFLIGGTALLAAFVTSQQVGGSIGTALLSTLAATAFNDYVGQHVPPSPAVLAEAAVESYTTTFWWAAAIFVVGAVITGFIMPDKAPVPAEGEPVLAH
ncbi:MFS transporter [Nocardia crassostreae]|uniref:MFS transporter n=1 Tax=Nocardia crassostreae TaxID=53428 RepID=UPI00082A11D4|nr:MFS transporter [Nocardia crassostreae]